MALVMTLTVSRLPWLSPTLRAILAAAGMTATVACGGGGVTRGFIGTTEDPGTSAPVDPSAGIPGDDLPSSPPLTPIGAPAPAPVPAPPVTPPPAPPPPPPAPAPVAASTLVEIPDLTASPGTTPGQVILRFTAPTPQAQSYVVRASERTVETDADAAKAATVAHTATPGRPGAPQTIVLSGLEEGQTLSFTVQAIRAGVSAPFGLAVSSRVPEGTITAPANAIRISAAGTLSQAGATYLLTQDVSVAGSAFVINARDVVLDLGGHTVTYGTAGGTSTGVRCEYLYGSGKVTIRNGSIVQGAGDGKSCPAIAFRGGHDIRLHHLELVVHGPDSMCIEVVERPTGEVEIDHNVVRCETKVVTSRHYPGVAAIYVTDNLQAVRIHHNKILSSPQWGIKLQGLETHGPALVHHNVIKGTKALVANGYMIGVYKPDVEVFENELAGESRGIHVDGTDGTGHRAYVHDNSITVQDQPNPEYPDFHWVHGIKLEGPDAARIERNAVSGVADEAHAEVRALDVDLSRGKNTRIVDNRFSGISRTTRLKGIALQWTGGNLDGVPVDATIRRNVFTATDRTIVRSWGAATGGLMDTNAFVRDLSLGAGQPFLVEYFDTSDVRSATGHRIRDAITTQSLRSVSQWVGPAPYSSSREWTLSLLVVDGAGRPVEGAGVAVRDRQGTVAFTATSNAAGVASGVVVETVVRNGPVFDGRGPFTISVTKAGVGTVDGSVAVAGRTALRIDLGAKTVQVDTAAPAAPAFELARPVAGSRAALRWSVPTDASGISVYQVFLDGVLVAIAEEPRTALAGLVPGATHVLTVKAIDRGGNVSASSSPVSIVMGADDRGL